MVHNIKGDAVCQGNGKEDHQADDQSVFVADGSGTDLVHLPFVFDLRFKGRSGGGTAIKKIVYRNTEDAADRSSGVDRRHFGRRCEKVVDA